MDRLESLLHRWAWAYAALPETKPTGRLAIEIVIRAGAHGLSRMYPSRAEQLAFRAVRQTLQEYDRLGDLDEPIESPAGVTHALLVLRAVQNWSTMTGQSPFAAGLSHNVTEALARYEAASRCDRISEAYEIGERSSVTCWYQAAHREAFRAVMRQPQILAGDDVLPEEMMRVAAAAHIVRLSRDVHAIQVFGRDEVEAISIVEEAVKRSSRRAIEQQKASNQGSCSARCDDGLAV